MMWFKLVERVISLQSKLPKLFSSRHAHPDRLVRQTEDSPPLPQQEAENHQHLSPPDLQFLLPNGTPYRLYLDPDKPDAYRSGVAVHGGQAPDWRLCMALLSPAKLFFDLGANIGAFAIPAAVLGAKVHAFELLADNATSIEKSAALNPGIDLSVTLGAVWDTPGAIGFAGHSAWGTIHPSAKTLIACFTIDNYTSQHQIQKLDLIKMDVEGAEHAILNGASATLERDRPDIIFESNTLTCGGFGYSYRTLLQHLVNKGYRIFRIGDQVLHPWHVGDVQEIVQTDYLATTLTDEHIATRSGWTIQPLTTAELIQTILGEDRFNDFHRMHVLSVMPSLAAAIQSNPAITSLMRNWEYLRTNPDMPRLRTGSAALTTTD